ncbi:hypothetical protein ScPMuIL_006757 [Solemya velum]
MPYLHSPTGSVNYTGILLVDEQAGYRHLTNAIYDGLLRVDVRLPGNEEYSLTADSILAVDQQTRTNVDIQHFAAFRRNSYIQQSDMTMTAVSIDSCASFCKLYLLSDCQAFSYCDSNVGTCMLSSVYPKEDQVPLQSRTDCTVWSRLYTDSYELTDGIVPYQQAFRSVASISSANQCAKQCSTSTDVICRSFHFCPTQKKCFMHKVRMGLATTGALPNSCVHYSKEGPPYAGRNQPPYLLLVLPAVEDRFDSMQTAYGKLDHEKLRLLPTIHCEIYWEANGEAKEIISHRAQLPDI